MIVINCGMPKSATTLVMEYQKDLIRAVRPSNGIEQESFGYLPDINQRVSRDLRRISADYGDFVVKTHSKPSYWIRRLIQKAEAAVTFSFRDPRDIMLSVIDHGNRTRKMLDPSGAFAEMETLEDTILFARASVHLYFSWRVFGKALFIKYESLMRDKPDHLRQISDYLNLDCSQRVLDKVYERHENLKQKAWNFNTGAVERWRTEMSQAWKQRCVDLFGDDLLAMGYDLY